MDRGDQREDQREVGSPPTSQAMPTGHHPVSKMLTLLGREPWELGPRQEVAVGDLVAKGRAWDPGHGADVVAIVTGHLHAAEAGQAT